MSTISKVGTPQWSAPEVLDSESSNINYEKADMWSMGVIMWEMLTGEMPWKDKRPDQVMMAVFFKKQTLAIPPDTNPALSRLIQSCWNADPSQRLTFQQFYIELGKIASSLDISMGKLESDIPHQKIEIVVETNEAELKKIAQEKFKREEEERKTREKEEAKRIEQERKQKEKEDKELEVVFLLIYF